MADGESPFADVDSAAGELRGSAARQIEVDESIALEADDDPIRITADPGFPDVPRDVVDEVCEAVENRLRTGLKEDVRDADLIISIDRYDPGSRLMRYMFPFISGAARVALSVSGTINDARVDIETRAARYMGAFGGDSDKMLEACLQDCLSNILLDLDTASGREPAPFAQFWNRLRIVRWVVAGLAFVAYAAIFGAMRLPKPGPIGAGGEWFFLVIGSLFMAVSCLGIVALGPLLFAPADFLLTDPRGMKLMTRAGTKSPAVMKAAAALIFLVSCGGVLLAVILLLESRQGQM
ncbi:MAG: hypothetical protein HY290_18340 [Planctomycetia bacterium]|nr:hypothetical protein [Planctomycetia bacterium]